MKPEQVLVDNNIAAQYWVEKAGVGHDVETQQHQGSRQDRRRKNHQDAGAQRTQQYIGNCINFSPGRRNLRIVAMKLMPPKMELPPAKEQQGSR